MDDRISSEAMKAFLLQRKNGTLVWMKITGDSMNPLLKGERDSCLLQKGRKVHKGDVVLFWRKDGGLVLHRVIHKKGDCLVVNGDAKLWSETIHRSQVLGVAVRFLRNRKKIAVSDWQYRLFVQAWMALKPVRKQLFWIDRSVRRRKLL